MAKAPNSPGLRVTRGNTMTISKGKRRAIAAMTDEQLREVRDELLRHLQAAESVAHGETFDAARLHDEVEAAGAGIGDLAALRGGFQVTNGDVGELSHDVTSFLILCCGWRGGVGGEYSERFVTTVRVT